MTPDLIPAPIPLRKPLRSARVKPMIYVRPDEDEVVDQAIDALAALPDIYRNARGLIRVVDDCTGAPAIESLPAGALRTRMTAAAEWLTLTRGKDGEKKRRIHPPQWAVSGVHAHGSWPGIRYLNGVTETPLLRPDGALLRPGYDPLTRLLYRPNADFPAVPDMPTKAAAKAACDRLLDLFSDFPFEAVEHRSALLAALLSPFARPAFDGPAPMFLFDANLPGTGKTLLADIIGYIVHGTRMPRTMQVLDENEERKAITAHALAGRSTILLDNIKHPLGSPALDIVLTGTLWSDRRLGTNDTINLPLRAVWYGSGNNIQFRDDTARRCLHIRLLSQHEHPEARQRFKYHPIEPYTQRYRARMVADALTLLRAYCAAGRPDVGLQPWGSFDAWSALVRGTIAWLELPDPILTRGAMQEMDTGRELASCLFRGLLELPDDAGRLGCTAGSIIAHLSDDRDGTRFPLLRSAVLEITKRKENSLPTSGSLGKALSKYKDRIVDGRVLRKGKDGYGERTWRLDAAATPPQ